MTWRDWFPWLKKSSSFDLLRALSSQFATSSGKTVNETTAIEQATVNACLRVLGEGVAQVPLKLMRLDGRQRLEARKHPLYEVLALRPNAWQTSFEYREMLVWHAALCGDAYSFINRGTYGRVIELIPFTPGAVTVKRAEDMTLTYDVQGQDGTRRTFKADQIWHLRGPSWNSWQGLSAVRNAREAIGLAMAAEHQQASLQKNGVVTSGVYSVEGTLGPEQYDALRKFLDSQGAGAANAFKAMILDRSAKWTPTAMKGTDAQTVETRRMQIEEICRYFRVNPIMIGAESKNTTYASAEQMFLAHLVHTLAPWYTRIEQSIDVNLLSEEDRSAGLYSNFVEEGLLRGSATTTKDVLLGYVNGGLMTPNEGRAKLDMDPILDSDSDELRVPTNIVGADNAKDD